MELCDGTLYEFLHERRQRKRPIIVLQNNNLLQFNEENEVVKLRANIAYQLARGMEQIHTTGICHCDLSSMNVLLKNGKVKIADFGVSLLASQTEATNLGTIRWRSPEMFKRTRKKSKNISDICTNKIDVFGYGVILWELFHSPHLPWEEIVDKEVEEKVLKGLRPKISDQCPSLWKSLIEKCWKEQPEQRPSFNFIVKYLTENIPESLKSLSQNVS